MSINITFGGANIQRPGAFSTVDTENMTPISVGSFKVLAMVGVPNAVNNVYAKAESIQNTIVGSITTAGNVSVKVTSANMPNSPKSIDVPVALTDIASAVATKIVSALQADTDISNFFTVSSAGAVITLTAKAVTVNDKSMKLTVSNGTCAGLTTTASIISAPSVLGGVMPFNDPTVAKTAIGASEALDLMNISWQYGADLIMFAPVAQTATDSEWQTAIDLLQSQFVDGVMVASNSPSINAKVQAHCDLMSTILNKKERRAFIGHATQLDVAGVSALQGYNDELVTMATPCPYVFDVNGNKVLKGSEYLASAYAGLWAGKASQDPITYDYVDFPGFEVDYLGTEINTLLANGVAPVEKVKKGYRIVQGVTTSDSEDLTEVELSVSTTKIDMNKDIRDYMEDKYVGKAGVAGIEVTIYNDLISLIEGFLKAGRITAYDKSSVSVVKNGTTFTTQWGGTPTLPINNFLLTTHLNLA